MKTQDRIEYAIGSRCRSMWASYYSSKRKNRDAFFQQVKFWCAVDLFHEFELSDPLGGNGWCFPLEYVCCANKRKRKHARKYAKYICKEGYYSKLILVTHNIITGFKPHPHGRTTKDRFDFGEPQYKTVTEFCYREFSNLAGSGGETALIWECDLRRLANGDRYRFPISAKNSIYQEFMDEKRGKFLCAISLDVDKTIERHRRVALYKRKIDRERLRLAQLGICKEWTCRRHIANSPDSTRLDLIALGVLG